MGHRSPHGAGSERNRRRARRARCAARSGGAAPSSVACPRALLGCHDRLCAGAALADGAALEGRWPSTRALSSGLCPPVRRFPSPESGRHRRRARLCRRTRHHQPSLGHARARAIRPLAQASERDPLRAISRCSVRCRWSSGARPRRSGAVALGSLHMRKAASADACDDAGAVARIDRAA